jgi:serine/threonine protein phosphatase PrpC
MHQPELTWGAASDPGLRQENQDRFLVAPPVFAVADGMGGHVGGAQASEHAVTRLAEIAGGPTVAVEAIRTALEQADKDILAFGESVDAASKPGTTVAGLAVVENDGALCWAVFHIGDSRIYRWTANGLERVSSDHSVVQALVDAGAITEERALTHPQRHMITKALGFGDRGQPDFTLLPVEAGQRFLVCSDGLTGELSDDRIAELLASDTDDQTVADQLVAEATRDGAQDNVSVVVVRVHGKGNRAAAELPM